MREAGQGRNPAALSEFECVLFFFLQPKNPLKLSFQRFLLSRFLLSCWYKASTRAESAWLSGKCGCFGRLWHALRPNVRPSVRLNDKLLGSILNIDINRLP